MAIHDPDAEDTPEQAAYRKDLQKWLSKNLPAKPKFHLPMSFLEVDQKDQVEYLQKWQRSLYEGGYMGLGVPEKFGGHGGQGWMQKIVNQELARAKAPTILNVIGVRMAMPTILSHGTEEQKKKYIPGILSCDEIWCQGFSEPNAGSDLGSAQTFAEKQGDSWLINGHKIWTTQGQFAKWMILLARTDKEAKKHAGLSYFLVPMQTEGIEVKPLTKMTREDSFNQTFFENVRIPAAQLLGQPGQGWMIAMTTLLHERGSGGSGDTGMHSAFEARIRQIASLAKRTKRGKKSMIDDPLVRDDLVKAAIEIEALRQHSGRVKFQKLQDYPMGIMSLSKLQQSELMMRLNEVANSIIGPDAWHWAESPGAFEHGDWELFHMNGYGPIIGGGTSEIQKNIIGERILGMAKG